MNNIRTYQLFIHMTYDYQYGYCHYFADIIIDEIRKLVPNDFPINYYLILAERLDNDGELIEDVLIHAYIKVGDYYLDSEGFHTIDDIDKREQEWLEIEETTTPDDYSFNSYQEESETIPKPFFNRFCKRDRVKNDIKEFIKQPKFQEFIKKLHDRV